MAESNPPTISSNNNKPFNLLGSMAISMEPVLTQLIHRMCADEESLKGKEEEMIQRYIHNNDKAWKKMVNKFKPKSTRSKSGYTIFLSDPVNIDKIKKENSTKMMKELNPSKGDKWKELRTNNTPLFQRYNKVAQLFNHKLIEFDDNNKEQVRNLIKTWMYDKSLEEVDNLLSNIKPIEKKKKAKKEKKVKVKKEKIKKEKKEKKEKKIKKRRLLLDSDDEEEDNNQTQEIQETIVDSDFENESSEFDVNATQFA